MGEMTERHRPGPHAAAALGAGGVCLLERGSCSHPAAAAACDIAAQRLPSGTTFITEASPLFCSRTWQPWGRFA